MNKLSNNSIISVNQLTVNPHRKTTVPAQQTESFANSALKVANMGLSSLGIDDRLEAELDIWHVQSQAVYGWAEDDPLRIGMYVPLCRKPAQLWRHHAGASVFFIHEGIHLLRFSAGFDDVTYYEAAATEGLAYYGEGLAQKHPDVPLKHGRGAIHHDSHDTSLGGTLLDGFHRTFDADEEIVDDPLVNEWLDGSVSFGGGNVSPIGVAGFHAVQKVISRGDVNFSEALVMPADEIL